MRISRIASALLLTALAGSAGAQLISPPVTATLVNFDDLNPNGQIPFNVVTNEYVNRGVQFVGFGQNSGGLFNPSFDPSSVPYISLPNNIYFFSAFPVITGGLAQSPEFLTFYPPIQYFQFDTGTFGQDCLGTSIVTIQGFAHDGTLLGSTTLTATVEGETLALTLPPPGAEQVVVTSSHNCGNPGDFLFGVELFSMDNVAFIPVAQSASKCAQGLDDAAGKQAKAVASCYAKALQTGLPVDDACLQKATDGLTKGFANSQKKGDCLVAPDADTTGAAVNAVIGQAIQMVTGGSPGPDVCFGKKLTSIGKKLQAVAKCFSSGAKSGVSTDPACVTKAGGSFNSSLKSCGTPTQLAPLEQLIDQFSIDLNRQQSVPTTTTTTTTTSTTTTTAPPPLGQHLSFTTSAGTTNCSISPPDSPIPPLSGELDSDLVGTKLADLGAGCLYIGGGAATVAPSLIPENATTVLDSPDGTTLAGSLGTSRADCSVGPQGATKHCVNNPPVECSNDAECFAPGGCQADPTCYFGPPVFVNGFPSSCVVNTFAQSASGTLNTATGESSVDIELASLVYLTLGQPTACPICDGGACNWGANAGQPCTTTNSTQTTLDCLPSPGIFVATLPVSLNPLTSSVVTTTAADGLFCPAQPHAGAFGQATTQAITQNGSPAGDLTDGAPHAGVLVSNFCIPQTGSLALDGLADLPGPGSLSLPGNAQFFAVP